MLAAALCPSRPFARPHLSSPFAPPRQFAVSGVTDYPFLNGQFVTVVSGPTATPDGWSSASPLYTVRTSGSEGLEALLVSIKRSYLTPFAVPARVVSIGGRVGVFVNQVAFTVQGEEALAEDGDLARPLLSRSLRALRSHAMPQGSSGGSLVQSFVLDDDERIVRVVQFGPTLATVGNRAGSGFEFTTSHGRVHLLKGSLCEREPLRAFSVANTRVLGAPGNGSAIVALEFHRGALTRVCTQRGSNLRNSHALPLPVTDNPRASPVRG